MLPFEDQFTRQRQLDEVGLEGQSRLEASLARVAPSPSGAIAAAYLSRAGVPVALESPSSPTSTPAWLEVFTFSGPADFAAGALLALDHVRAVLSIGARSNSSGANAQLPLVTATTHSAVPESTAVSAEPERR